MSRTAKVTFVGPLAYQGKRNTKRVTTAEFWILQQGGTLKLKYPSMDEAISARRAILSDHYSYAVPSNKLLGAIQTALEQAKDPDHHDQSSAHGDPGFSVPGTGHEASQ